MTDSHQQIMQIKGTPGKGRGVFAARDIRRGELIEAAPVIVMPDDHVEWIEKTVLSDYYYLWGESHIAVVLGYGSLYNHSTSPNVSFYPDTINKAMIYEARKRIRKDEELLIDYQCQLWFAPLK
jgi:uncharacterized protein